MTRAPELMAADVNVAFGHDCVMSPWYGLGQADTLEVAHMGLHVPQMTSQKGIRACFDAATTNVAKVMRLQGYGLEVGCNASFVLLRARDAGESSEGLAEGDAGAYFFGKTDSNGLKSSTPKSEKSATLRVTTFS